MFRSAATGERRGEADGVDQFALPLVVLVRREADVVVACQKGRAMAAQVGFSRERQFAISVAIAEVARNVVKYAGRGEITMRPCLQQDGRTGLLVVARDEGPGIPDVEQALQDGYSTGGGLGIGLSGAKRLMDEFEIVSRVGQGTTIVMTKWKQ
ncbi:MAG: ATP-binding protein [Chloroflexi bacterium]|nr:MAG: ATP-binding protein [Chloroflexota bacterium]